MDNLMRFLFKHERAVFTKGQFAFDARASLPLLLFVALLLAIFVYYVYLQPRSRISRGSLFGLIALRVTFFVFLIFLLLRPVIIVPSVIPRSSDVALLIDDSQSMQLTDEANGVSRSEAAKSALLLGDDSPLRKLNEKFKVDLFAYARQAKQVNGADELLAEGNNTDLAASLDGLVRRATTRPLSAIVVVGDGAHNARSDVDAQLRQLRARNIPIFTVGVGRTRHARDLEVMQARVPRRALAGSNLSAEVLMRASGDGQIKAALAVREDGRTVKTQEVDLRGSGEAQAVSVEWQPASAGLHRYTFALTPLAGELTEVNNAQEALIEVTAGPVKVLYIEGEPRWEYGKMRTSLTRNEKNITLISFLRSGENKFYRQGIEGENDLAKGFPQTLEELFGYQGLILGSVEASFFSVEQLKNIEAFVARRGGGFLMLGGRNSYGRGRFDNTPIADLLPLTFDGRNSGDAETATPVFKPQMSARGRAHPVLRLADDDARNQKIWDELPALTVPQPTSGVKPGASVLLEARRLTNNKPAGASIPLLAEQRYGRGLSLALTASDTWRWQMKTDSKSNLHETFWRQTLRHLAGTAPQRVEVGAEQSSYAAGETVRVTADVRDGKYEPIKDAKLTARVTKPSGATEDVPLAFTTRDSLDIYEAELTPDEIGQFHVELIGDKADARLAPAASDFIVGEATREFFDARQHDELLRRIADETGGKYYTVGEARRLIDDLTYRDSPNSERVVKELWDMPINLLLLIALISAEWFWRKRSGLA